MYAKWWILKAVNAHRMMRGLPPLHIHEDNSRDAQRFAQYLLDSGLIFRFYFYAHELTNFRANFQAESIGFMRLRESELKQYHIDWLIWELVEREEEGHTRHILRPDYTHLGADVAFDGMNLVLVQRFSRI